MSDLYDTDVLEWSQRQAELLRRHASGEKLNEQPDWANIIEEVESVGQSQIDAIESWLFQAFLHELKIQAWPESRDAPAWRNEARSFRVQARRKYRPSMRQRLDLPDIYAAALSALPDNMDGLPPQPVSPTCPIGIDELMTQQQ